jgi:hypothetical protein
VKRALLGLLSVVMVIVGAGLLAISGWIYAAFGSNGVASSSLGEISSAPTSSAIVIDVDAARVRIPVLPVHGSTTLGLSSADGTALLAGTSDMTTVDEYLGNREFDAAYRSGGSWTLTHVPGSQVESPWVSPPAWLSSGESVDISLQDGHTVAIANANGSAGVVVRASLQFSAPNAPKAALALAVSGGVLLLGGIALAFSAAWLMRRRRDELAE